MLCDCDEPTHTPIMHTRSTIAYNAKNRYCKSQVFKHLVLHFYLSDYAVVCRGNVVGY